MSSECYLSKCQSRPVVDLVVLYVIDVLNATMIVRRLPKMMVLYANAMCLIFHLIIADFAVGTEANCTRILFKIVPLETVTYLQGREAQACGLHLNCERIGANTLTSRSSDFTMGVPIKKRKFPVMRSPSPTPVTDPVSPLKHVSNVKQEPSYLIEDILASASRVSGNIPSSLQEDTREHSSERNDELVGKGDPCGCGIQEANIEIAPRSEAELYCKSTHVTACDMVGTELQLAPKSSLKPKVEEDMGIEIERNVTKIDERNLLTKSVEIPQVERSFPDLTEKLIGGIFEEEKLDPCLWNLALTEMQSSSSSNQGTDSNIVCPRQQQTNRTNWDLNTMMDTWEGSMNHSDIVNEVGLDRKNYRDRATHSNKIVCSESKASPIASGQNRVEQIKGISKLSSLSASPDLQPKTDVLLHLSLSTSSGLHSDFGAESSHRSLKVDLRSGLSHKLKSKNMVPPSSSLNLAGSRTVKSEPCEESAKLDSHVVKETPLKLMKARTVKSEPCGVGYFLDPHQSDIINNLKTVNNGDVKLEPVCGKKLESLRLAEEKSRRLEVYRCNKERLLSSSEVLRVLDGPNCKMADPVTLLPPSCTTSLGLSASAEASSNSEIPNSTNVTPSAVEVVQEENRIVSAVALDLVSDLVHTGALESAAADDISGIPSVDCHDVTGLKSSITLSGDKLRFDVHGNSDVTGSEDEKLNIFDDMQDDCSSDMDDDSDSNNRAFGIHKFGILMNKSHGCEDDEYEDGEVREPLLYTAAEDVVGPDGGIEPANCGVSNNMEYNDSVAAAGNGVDWSDVENRVVSVEDPHKAKSSHYSGLNIVQHSNNHDQCQSEVTCLQDTLAVELPTTGIRKNKLVMAAQRVPIDHAGMEDGIKGSGKVLLPAGAISASPGTSAGDDQGSRISQQENVKGINVEETNSPVESKSEPVVNGTEATKDVNSRGNQSRIINLDRALSGLSPGRMRRILPSRIGREKYNDCLRSGDALHPRGHRDEDSIDGRHNFERQRNQDQPVGNTGADYMDGRGRSEKRFDSTNGDWDSHYNFTTKNFNCPTTYRVSGTKNAAAVMVAREGNGTVVGASRKSLIHEMQDFRDPPSRRRSPGGRGGPASHGVQIIRRSARDISPDRCIGRADSNMIGLRTEKKFMRGLPDEMMDDVYSRTQAQYQQFDDHFVRRERSFSPIQRKRNLHIPRIRSRSPSRTRSPGPWSSPRRSPDGFGRPELIRRRSPPFYRVKRIRSPHQRSCFAEDITGRRHGSPPCISRISNGMREMGASREHDNPRSFISTRSPSGRVLPRGTRRFNIIDPRERIENDEYFAGHMHSDRFHEIRDDGAAEGRRMSGDRRRSYRPHYDSADVEKFHFHFEGGPRPYRFSPEADQEFHERGNFREREFERRVKSRSGNGSRRTRSIEENEENYRHGEQGWLPAAFEDVSSAKRRRF
ncbi:hypothetical protein IFM89_000139 [Coptis chinensis]|uniref:Uncharacterized protein n=1 Tax=Coptis chinensis TaxID=261450 RepID=A0A835H3G7_9MAGN|nr:hypothetical protein IFM89_000139 [Coptis chinensis]